MLLVLLVLPMPVASNPGSTNSLIVPVDLEILVVLVALAAPVVLSMLPEVPVALVAREAPAVAVVLTTLEYWQHL